jgi:hypothetical protein
MTNKLYFFLFLILFFLLNLTMTGLEAEPMEFPDTPAGKRAIEIVALLNGTFSRPAEDYIQNDYAPSFRDAFPLAAHKQIFTTTKTMFGTLSLAYISSSTLTEIQFTLRSKSRDAWLNVNLKVEADPPHRITVLGIRPGSRPAALDKEDKESTEIAQDTREKTSATQPIEMANVDPVELHKMISSKAKKDEFSGVVLVAKDGRPLF